MKNAHKYPKTNLVVARNCDVHILKRRIRVHKRDYRKIAKRRFLHGLVISHRVRDDQKTRLFEVLMVSIRETAGRETLRDWRGLKMRIPISGLSVSIFSYNPDLIADVLHELQRSALDKLARSNHTNVRRILHRRNGLRSQHKLIPSTLQVDQLNA